MAGNLQAPLKHDQSIYAVDDGWTAMQLTKCSILQDNKYYLFLVSRRGNSKNNCCRELVPEAGKLETWILPREIL